MASQKNTLKDFQSPLDSTPIRSISPEEESMLNSMRKRVTSTAMRPGPTNKIHNTICLEDTINVSCLDEHEPVQHMPSTQNVNPRPPRTSSMWLEEVINGMGNIAEQLKRTDLELEASRSRMSDFSSLGILTQSGMAKNGFDVSQGESDSFMALQMPKPTKPLQEKFALTPSQEKRPAYTEQSVQNCTTNQEFEDHLKDLEDQTLLAETLEEKNEDKNGIQNPFSFSGDQFSDIPDFQLEVSGDFVAGDSSVIKKRLDNDETSFIRAAKETEAIPSPQRMEFGDFSGYFGEGDITIRPSWVSPEKRKYLPKRLSIGQYFSLKSSKINELDTSLLSNKPKFHIDGPANKSDASTKSPLPTGLRPELLSKTIDLTEKSPKENSQCAYSNSITEQSDKTYKISSYHPSQDCSLMSLSSIANILDHPKGSDTIIEHLFNKAQNHKNFSNKDVHANEAAVSMENIPANDSRETFVISPAQHRQESSRSKTSSHSDSNVPSHSATIPPKIPVNLNSEKSPKHISTTGINTLVKPSRKSSATKKSDQHNLLNNSRNPIRMGLSKPSSGSFPKKVSPANIAPWICLPLMVQGFEELSCISCVETILMISVISVAQTSLKCSGALRKGEHSNHIDIKPSTTLLLHPGKCGVLILKATALLSGNHEIWLDVKVTDVQSNETRVYPVKPFTLQVESPKVTITKQYKDGIDFGLRPEGSPKEQIISIKNSSPIILPIHIYIKQTNPDVPTYFFLVPCEENELSQRVTAMKFLLPGFSDGQPGFQEIIVQFLTPYLEDLTNVPTIQKRVTLTAEILVSLEMEESCSEVAMALGKRVLDQCVVTGCVGHTQLLVSQASLNLHPGSSQHLGLKNDGVVPLTLNLVAQLLQENGEEEEPVEDKGIEVQPPKLLMLPGEESTVFLKWTAQQGQTEVIQRELHLHIEDCEIDNIVSLECFPSETRLLSPKPHSRPSTSSVKMYLPLRTTRPQLAWGSLSPGQTSKEMVSYKNCGPIVLQVHVTITAKDWQYNQEDLPFKLLSEAGEVTRELEVRFAPGQERRIAVMFSPLRMGAAYASLNLNVSQPDMRGTKNVKLTGFGGNSQVVLRQVASSGDKKWLMLNPGLSDLVDGGFSVVNSGSLPAFVHITGVLISQLKDTSKLVIKPESFIVPCRGHMKVVVKVSGVKGALGEAHSGEVKNLASLQVTWFNEVTRRRLRRLLTSLNPSEQSTHMRLDYGQILGNLVKLQIDGENLVPEAAVAMLHDYGAVSALSLCRDIISMELELRAMGTGANQSRVYEAETISPFVTMLDGSCAANTSFSPSTTMSDVSRVGSQQLGTFIEWSVNPQECHLHSSNNYNATLQVCNLSASTRLTLELYAREEVIVSPMVVELPACQTISLQVRLRRHVQIQHAVWPAGIKVYSSNDCIEVAVKVTPPASSQRSHKSNSFGRSSLLSGSSVEIPKKVNKWVTPAKPSSSNSASNSDLAKNLGVYVSTSKVTFFPWSDVATSTKQTLTIFNNSDENFKVLPTPLFSPFSVETSCIEVPSNWHKNIAVTFCPQSRGEFKGTLLLKVLKDNGDEEKTITVQLHGFAEG